MRQTIPQTPAEREGVRLIERPDGFYWQSREDGREYGPFATLVEAMQDLQGIDEEAPEAGETLAEAEAEIGIPDGIDPETGERADQDGSHLEEH
jgi:hypothetical protein